MQKKIIRFAGLIILGVIILFFCLMLWPVSESKTIRNDQDPSMKDNTIPQPEETKKPPVLQGEITKLDDQIITVEQYPNKQNEGAKGDVTINEQTKIYLKQGEKWNAVDKADIKQGMKASVWYDGVMIMIYPMQISADIIMIEP